MDLISYFLVKYEMYEIKSTTKFSTFTVPNVVVPTPGAAKPPRRGPGLLSPECPSVSLSVRPSVRPSVTHFLKPLLDEIAPKFFYILLSSVAQSSRARFSIKAFVTEILIDLCFAYEHQKAAAGENFENCEY